MLFHFPSKGDIVAALVDPLAPRYSTVSPAC
ncbi:hypothetical protein K7711_03080 [Nocardia sp. CA2R105]|nr:hypothetical protein [Nocardia coffeae]